jgi:hypothetical protein
MGQDFWPIPKFSMFGAVEPGNDTGG